MLFGTNGFLVLHAILIALDLLVIYLFVLAATKSNWVALAAGHRVSGVSVVPVYFVWLVPELFNFSLVLYAVFFWAYKEVAGARALAPAAPCSTHPRRPGVRLHRGGADRRWRRSRSRRTCSCWCPWCCSPQAGASGDAPRASCVICGAVTAALFALNAAITGEFNYQGGDRKTFYSLHRISVREYLGDVRQHRSRARAGRSDGRRRAREHALRHGASPQPLVLPRRPQCRACCRISFPACSRCVLFLFSRQKHLWQWLALATIAGVVVMHVFVWPFTWNGGGGPVGSRYFLPFYALFLVLIPATAGVGAAMTAFVIGALFTAQIAAEPVLRLAARRASTPNRARCGCCRSN